MNFAFLAAGQQGELLYVWDKATIEGKAIIIILAVFSVFAWSVMAAKALQMRRAKHTLRAQVHLLHY